MFIVYWTSNVQQLNNIIVNSVSDLLVFMINAFILALLAWFIELNTCFVHYALSKLYILVQAVYLGS